MKEKGWHHYSTAENKHYITGTADLYYGYKKYHKARNSYLLTNKKEFSKKMDELFDRLRYIIYKEDEDSKTLPHGPSPDGKIPTEIILLNDNGLMLDWETEFKKGLDSIYVQHPWLDAPSINGAYRFANGVNLHPIGAISWIAPDLFCWHKH